MRGLFVVGPPGAGKSHLLNTVRTRVGGNVVSSDEIRSLVIARRGGSPEDGDQYLTGPVPSADRYQEWLTVHDSAVLEIAADFAMDGYVVELGGELGTKIDAAQRKSALCIVPALPVILDRLAERARSDALAKAWLDAGGSELVRQWHSIFSKLGVGLGRHENSELALVELAGMMEAG